MAVAVGVTTVRPVAGVGAATRDAVVFREHHARTVRQAAGAFTIAIIVITAVAEAAFTAQTLVSAVGQAVFVALATVVITAVAEAAFTAQTLVSAVGEAVLVARTILVNAIHVRSINSLAFLGHLDINGFGRS